MLIVICLNKTFRHVEALFVQDNQVRTDQNKPLFVCLFVLFCLSLFEVCFDLYELDYLGRIKYIHVEMLYYHNIINVTMCTEVGPHVMIFRQLRNNNNHPCLFLSKDGFCSVKSPLAWPYLPSSKNKSYFSCFFFKYVRYIFCISFVYL